MDLRSFLREKITTWSELSKRHTLLHLAERSQLGYSTVRRLASGDGEANLQSLLQLASVILSPEDTRQALQDFFPGARLGLERPFRFFPNEKTDPITHKEALLAVALSCPDSGIEQSELETILGSRASRCIQTLVDAEILCRQDSKLKLASDYFFDPNPDHILRWMGYILELFDRAQVEMHGNMTSLRIAGLNDKGVQKLQTVMVEAEKAIQAILEDSNLQGSQSVATILVSTILNAQAPTP